MAVLIWDQVSDRIYQTGLDRGVLYLPDGTAVPWNGLIDVVEKPTKDKQEVYYDGKKINDLVNIGPFLGSMKAITYPDEFVEFEGLAEISLGMHFGEQSTKLFGLSWRTRIGNGLTEDLGYKIHILYNVTAIPNDKTYSTITEDPNIANFEWEISAIPEEVEGFRPTAHIIIDSRYVEADQLEEIEGILYGTSSTSATQIPLVDFLNYLYFGYKWKIIDNGDGTWTAITPIAGLIEYDVVDPDLFTLDDVNGVYLTSEVYQIEDSFA